MIRRVTLVGLVALLAAACSTPNAPLPPSLGPAPSSRITLDYPDSRVTVQVAYSGESGRRVVKASFVPTEVGLHLYATEMADDGIDGAGRPTRLVVRDPGWQASGPVVASQESEELKVLGFDKPFPVYRDGPVSLEQEVVQHDPTDHAIDVRIGFMACSARVCFLPVWDVKVTVGID
jgi:hypothetical protein